MTYRLPDTMPALNRIVRKHSLQFSTERQAAFMLQQLAGTRLKFPPKGESCFPILLKMEKVVTGNFTSEKTSAPSAPTVRSDRTVAVTTPKAKRGKTARPKSPRPATTSATGFDTGLVIFCDGACEPNPGAGGWGFVVYRDGVEIHSECGGAEPATNNTMEMTGALMALRWFAERGIVEPVRLLCDSQYVVNGCNDWRHGWKKKGWRRKGKVATLANADLWRELDEALTLVPITLEWLKGHVGTLGNERADELAEMGRATVLTLEADPIADQLRYVAA